MRPLTALCPICQTVFPQPKAWGRPKKYCPDCTPFVRQHEHNHNGWRHTHPVKEYVLKRRSEE